MARLRLASVEYRRCGACARDYTGSLCPHCGEPASVLTARLLKTLLIVDDPQAPLYQREERWSCRSCGQLYVPPPIARVFSSALRCPCGGAAFTRAELGDMLSGATLPLEQARRLVTAIKRRKRCPDCGQPLRPPCWCPLCSVTTLASSSDLPYRPTWVYAPTGMRAVCSEAVSAQTHPGSDEDPPDAEDSPAEALIDRAEDLDHED